MSFAPLDEDKKRENENESENWILRSKIVGKITEFINEFKVMTWKTFPI